MLYSDGSREVSHTIIEVENVPNCHVVLLVAQLPLYVEWSLAEDLVP